MIAGLVEDSHEVEETNLDTFVGLVELFDFSRARIEGCMVAFADLLDSATKLIALEEEDEDEFVAVLALNMDDRLENPLFIFRFFKTYCLRILKRLIDRMLANEDISS